MYVFSGFIHEMTSSVVVGEVPMAPDLLRDVAKGVGAAGLALYVGRDWQRRRMAYELSETLHSSDMLDVRQELSELMLKARLLKSVYEQDTQKPKFDHEKDEYIRSLTEKDSRLRADGIHLEGYFVLDPKVEDEGLEYDSKVVLDRQYGRPYERESKHQDFNASHALSRMIYFVCRVAQLHRNGMVHRGMAAQLFSSFFSHYRLALLEFSDSYRELSYKLDEDEKLKGHQDTDSIPDNIDHFFRMLGMSLRLESDYRYFSKHENLTLRDSP